MSNLAETARSTIGDDPVAAAVDIIHALDGWNEAIERLTAPAYLTDAAGLIQRANPAFEALSASHRWSLREAGGEAVLGANCGLHVAVAGGAPIAGLIGIAEADDGERLVFAAYPAPLMSEERELAGALNVFFAPGEGRVALLQALAARYARINRRLLHLPTANALRRMADDLENQALDIVRARDA